MSEVLTLVIGNKCYSSWSLRAWLFLKHSGISFNEHRIPLDTEQWRREIHDHSPSGKVPVLKHGDLCVWDTMAICEYVSENFLDGGGWPPNPNARAMARSVSAEMHSGFPHLRTHLPMNCRRRFPEFPIPDAAAMDIARILEIWRFCRTNYAVEGPWLFGEFSIADAMYAPVALRFHGYDVNLSGVEGNYVNTILGDEAVREWIDAAYVEAEVIAAEEVDHPHVAFV
ncbi:MAG: glutathione S-transferase family protein [Gammaproteobacteria bacterium]|nr:glutathione S-transferase family protein [Gammaproteobacteria bacterium]